ncbi:MAG TPA: GGDEF domain-containing protein [Pseudonocardiaceae bacterium]|nr:GGDEF domain-containing protein [Pseudonocardiaceae bacterium]
MPTSEDAQIGAKWQPRRWTVWSHPRPVVVYILLVEAMALAPVAITARLTPITPKSLLWLGLLMVGVVIHKEASCAIERIREIDREGSPHTNLQSIWFFAAILMLPLPLAAAVVAFSYGYAWLRVYQRRPPLHRKVFSAATIVLATGTAQLALSLTAAPGRRFAAPAISTLTGPIALPVIVAAGLLYWLINYALVVAILIMTHPGNPGSKALGDPTEQVLIGAGVCLGYGIALVADIRPWMLPIMLGLVLGLHVGLLVPHYQRAARTDAKTGLASVSFWYAQAERELARAAGTDTTLGILMIDLDRFKDINDLYGHLCGDAVLNAVAGAMKDAVRSYDLVGRLGGEEFGALIPGATSETILATAERLRSAIKRAVVRSTANNGATVTIGNLTASIGAAVFPASARTVTGLSQAADAALYFAKENGRDQAHLAPVTGAGAQA